MKDFLLKQGFEIGKADATLFTRRVNNDIFVCQIYIDDIIFGSANVTFCEEFSRIMTNRFEISMMGELKFFLGFQIKQLKDSAFISQTKYTLLILAYGILKVPLLSYLAIPIRIMPVAK